LGFEIRKEPVKDLSYQDILERVYGDDEKSKDGGGSDEDEWDESVESDDDNQVGNQKAM
jgi:hypothetical protein